MVLRQRWPLAACAAPRKQHHFAGLTKVRRGWTEWLPCLQNPVCLSLPLVPGSSQSENCYLMRPEGHGLYGLVLMTSRHL